MMLAAVAIAYDDMESSAFEELDSDEFTAVDEFGASARTPTYTLHIGELVVVERMVSKARFYPAEALAEILLHFGDEARRAAAIAYLVDIAMKRDGR